MGASCFFSAIYIQQHLSYYMVSENIDFILLYISEQTNEPPHEKTNILTYAPSKDSDQSGHLPSLIRVFAVLSWVTEDLSFPHADSED